MGTILNTSTSLCTLLSLFSFSILSLSPSLATFSSSPYNSCNITPYPAFCTTTLPLNYSSSKHDQARFFLQQSLSITKTIHELVTSYLRNQFNIPQSTVHALEDCHNLAEQNIDFLSSVLQAIENRNLTNQQDHCDLQTLLSAILTNHQTCIDGFHEVAPYPKITNALSIPLSDGAKLYSITLAFFTRFWRVSNAREREKSTRVEKITHRKLLQRRIPNVIVRQRVVVNPDGSGDFTTINDAVDAAPNNAGATNNGYHVIYVVAGVYDEHVSIARSKENVMVVGDGINRTVITGNRSVVDGWTTFQSATFAVVGRGFVAVNITFRNTAGPSKHQAVALRNGADISTFYHCSFEGHQDTLYAHSFRQFYKSCDIYGTVDFIFGNAAAVFQNCNIFARLPLRNQFNAITAQGRTDPNQNTGFSIQNCYVVASSELGDGANNNYSGVKTYLGRPWKEYSRTVFMECYMGGLIDTKGWIEWSGDFGLRTVYYAEYANRGPGANTSERVTWEGFHLIGRKDAGDFTVHRFIQGENWLHKTGVPFKGGLP